MSFRITLSDLAKYSMTRSIARPLCVISAYCVIYGAARAELRWVEMTVGIQYGHNECVSTLFLYDYSSSLLPLLLFYYRRRVYWTSLRYPPLCLPTSYDTLRCYEAWNEVTRLHCAVSTSCQLIGCVQRTVLYSSARRQSTWRHTLLLFGRRLHIKYRYFVDNN